MKRRLRISYNAPVILTFVICCCIVTILGLITNQSSTLLLFSVYRGRLSNPFTYVRLVTHVLGHVDFAHFAGNAMYLLLIGPMLEEKYGSKTMIKVILATAIVTGLVHCFFWGNSTLCGASGIVFALIILSSFTAFKDGEIPLSFILVAFLFIGKEIYDGITIKDNVSNITHILGGFIGGMVGYSLNRKN